MSDRVTSKLGVPGSTNRPRSNSTLVGGIARQRDRGMPDGLVGKELFQRPRSTSVSVHTPQSQTYGTPRGDYWTGTGGRFGGSHAALSDNAGAFFFGDRPAFGDYDDGNRKAVGGSKPKKVDTVDTVDGALQRMSRTADELEMARAECDRAEMVAVRVNAQLSTAKFWADIASAVNPASVTPSVSPITSPDGGRLTASPPRSNGASPADVGLAGGTVRPAPPFSPSRGLTPSPDALRLSPDSMEAAKVVRAMRARLRVLESAVTEAERGSGTEAERDYVLSQLQNVADGPMKELADELGAIREVWIELFGETNFDLEMLRTKLQEGEAEVTHLDAALHDVVLELAALHERLAAAKPGENDVRFLSHDEEEADRKEKAHLQLQLTEGLKTIEETKQALETTGQAFEAETAALERAKAQLAAAEAEEQQLAETNAHLADDLAEVEQVLAQTLEGEEELARESATREQEAAAAAVHLEQLNEVLASQSADLDRQERARDALLQTRKQAERDRRDEQVARQTEAVTLAQRQTEIQNDIVSMSDQISDLGARKREALGRHRQMVRELRQACEDAPPAKDDPSVEDYIEAIRDKRHRVWHDGVGDLEATVGRLRTELRELEASHSAHKQYITDNNLILEHLESRTHELEAEPSDTAAPAGPSPTWSDGGHDPRSSPTRRLMDTLKEHTDSPRVATGPDTPQAIQLAVESEIELSRLAKVVHQTSLAIRATVAKRNRLEEWSRANDLRQWLPDASVRKCMACHDEFNFFNRRHHCRVCGKIFCADCSQLRVKIAKSWRDVRCCEQCMDELEMLSCELSDDVTPEPPAAHPMPHCISSTCKLQEGSHCYSPACQRYLAEAALDFERHLRFEALLLEVKLKCGRAQNSSDELYLASVRMRVPESEWGDFLYQSLTNGLVDLEFRPNSR